MYFEHPAFLILLLLTPVLWWSFRRTPGSSLTCLVLKCAVFVALVVALAAPWARLPKQKLAVTMVMDISSSMPVESIQRGENLLRNLVRNDSGSELRLITVGDRARQYAVPRQASLVKVPLVGDSNRETGSDLEAGLQLALGTFPQQQGVRRVVMFTDGNENRGDLLAGALRAREKGVEVFTVASGGAVRLPVQVESVALPQRVFSGERFTLSLRLGSSRPLAARMAITFQGQEIGAAPVQLQAGSNPVDMDARITGIGVSLLEVKISGEGTDRVLFSQAVTVSRPRVLYVAGIGGPSQPLMETLKRAEVEVETRPEFPEDIPVKDWDAVVLDNYPDHELSMAESESIAKYVFAGGGLIFIAGENNAQLAKEPRTPFDKVLPVRGDPDTPEKPTALVLVLDKSQSMSGQKIEMAREAAQASLQTVRPTDRIGIIAFDDTFRWVVPIETASDLPRLIKQVDTIVADGSTRIYPPLKAAFDAIRLEKVARRHIIMMTDGVSPPGDMPQLLKDAAAQHITISTIGLGSDVNREMLEEIAKTARGRAYFVEDPTNLPQVMGEETRKVKISLIQDDPVRAVAIQPVEFTDGVNFNRAPRLLGFVRAKAKENTETILRVATGEPLLVRWQFGLGRVIAFMSDARGRWAKNWVSWESFGTLWPQMIRDVSSRDRKVRVGIRAGSNEGERIVFYDVVEGEGPGAASVAEAKAGVAANVAPKILVAAPGEAARAIPLEETAPNHYEAHIPASAHGLYRIVSGSTEVSLPESGFYSESDEMAPKEVNRSLLQQVSAVTGGRMNPTIQQVLDRKGSLVMEPRALWPYWLMLAIVINFLEIAIRKGFFQRLRSNSGKSGGSRFPRIGRRRQTAEAAPMIPAVSDIRR